MRGYSFVTCEKRITGWLLEAGTGAAASLRPACATIAEVAQLDAGAVVQSNDYRPSSSVTASFQRLIYIGDEIIAVFDADADPHEPVGDADRGTLGGRHGSV